MEVTGSILVTYQLIQRQRKYMKALDFDPRGDFI
jgi:hypothetical protein